MNTLAILSINMTMPVKMRSDIFSSVVRMAKKLRFMRTEPEITDVWIMIN